MKLSELFRIPFKLKGGSTLNLRGFSKRVVDKEIGEGGGGGESGVIGKVIEQLYNAQMIPHSSKFCDYTNGRITDISDIDVNKYYYFLYKESDYTKLSSDDKINKYFICRESEMTLFFSKKYDVYIMYTFIIDGESYITLGEGY